MEIRYVLIYKNSADELFTIPCVSRRVFAELLSKQELWRDAGFTGSVWISGGFKCAEYLEVFAGEDSRWGIIGGS